MDNMPELKREMEPQELTSGMVEAAEKEKEEPCRPRLPYNDDDDPDCDERLRPPTFEEAAYYQAKKTDFVDEDYGEQVLCVLFYRNWGWPQARVLFTMYPDTFHAACKHKASIRLLGHLARARAIGGVYIYGEDVI